MIKTRKCNTISLARNTDRPFVKYINLWPINLDNESNLIYDLNGNLANI